MTRTQFPENLTSQSFEAFCARLPPPRASGLLFAGTCGGPFHLVENGIRHRAGKGVCEVGNKNLVGTIGHELERTTRYVRTFGFRFGGESDGVLGEEYLTLQETVAELAARPDAVALPPVQITDEPSKPFGHGLYTSASTIASNSATPRNALEPTRLTLLRSPNPKSRCAAKFREILKESDQARAPGTTVERQARWNIGSSPGTGNAANAAAVASATATKVRIRCPTSCPGACQRDRQKREGPSAREKGTRKAKIMDAIEDSSGDADEGPVKALAPSARRKGGFKAKRVMGSDDADEAPVNAPAKETGKKPSARSKGRFKEKEAEKDLCQEMDAGSDHSDAYAESGNDRTTQNAKKPDKTPVRKLPSRKKK
ncbi:hypothetical protein B0H14DRAFT_2599670 [Mycena olivaceomarginata]|nr:hypothetical protein B0H14DRAFT_2599670 [Mycena olivaceomarginata]